ncbi:uncharacterized protein LOC110036857 [Phalaenopsis equestris]|uniref:uncharacterized protein LOC110036857 n=1 Tax=Phalaenopsis equestris TaxID=78828 RepID=UPI0009E2FD93|nr:uncharacterized protein LOC110036857 [Phalaenopsis equestris]
MFSGSHERWAAITIQTFFRGYLARKALRAMKALVKLQALVRGYLVRKRAELVSQSGRRVVRLHSNARRSRKLQLQSRIQECFDDSIIQKTDPPSLRRFPLRNDCSSSSHKAFQYYSGEKCRCCSTASQCTLRLLSSSVTAPATPAKLGPEAFSRKHGSPNYMSNTQSFVGKLRSQSAPRQRAEVVARTAMNDILEAGIVPVRRSCSQIPDAVRFRSAVVKKLVERSREI